MKNPVKFFESGEEGCGFSGPGWYFFDETWCFINGPYESENAANVGLSIYCRNLDYY